MWLARKTWMQKGGGDSPVSRDSCCKISLTMYARMRMQVLILDDYMFFCFAYVNYHHICILCICGLGLLLFIVLVDP